MPTYLKTGEFKKFMFIQTQETDSIDKLNFLPGKRVFISGKKQFSTQKEAEESPLAKSIFQIHGVEVVSLDIDRILITKNSNADWLTIKPAILGKIMEHFTSNNETEEKEEGNKVVNEDLVNTGEISEQILDLLETRIRPVAKDQGGQVEFVGFNESAGRVHLSLSGSAINLLGGIQTMLRHYVPEVGEVVNHDQWIPKPGLDTDEGRAVQEILDNEINPGVASHGGNVTLIDIAEHTAYVEFGGGCHGCGMVDLTLKQGVEARIMEAVPSIIAVMDTTDHAEGTNPYFKE